MTLRVWMESLRGCHHVRVYVYLGDVLYATGGAYGAIRSYAYREPTELPCACTDGVPVLSYGEHWSIPCAEHPVSYTEHYSRMDECIHTLATKRSNVLVDAYGYARGW
jgi:hypothetical protein